MSTEPSELGRNFERIRYELAEPNVARITLARPEMHNAQDHQMLYELDGAFQEAAQNPEVKVIILAADGKNFSSGHDTSEEPSLGRITPIVQGAGHFEPGALGQYAGEEEYYVGLCWRWRNLAKPTIAQVQGKAIAGGLMLIWPMDLVVASDDAQFCDPVVLFGLPGHEYFLHAWEYGPRKAKEALFTGATFSAEECREMGMVNHVVPRADLERFTLELARKIATRPSAGLRLAKQAVNFSLDVQGQQQVLTGTLAMHEFGHAHARVQYGGPSDPSAIEVIRQESRAAGKSTPEDRN